MSILGPILSVVFVVIVARMLLKNYYPHAVLLVAGLLMLILAFILGKEMPVLLQPSGTFTFDLFALIKESFAETSIGVGLLIMAIGGFVAYIDSIGASDALVVVVMKPLSLLRKYPFVAAAAVIPIGQLLFIAIPSAAGLSLLLMASIFPILVNLGVSNLTAVSVITASTALGVGPASAISVRAANIAGISPVSYFVDWQINIFIILTIVLTLTYYITSRYYDSKMKPEDKNPGMKAQKATQSAPALYAFIPILPIVLLLIFSEFNTWFAKPIVIDTTTAMFASLFVALILELIRKRNLKTVLASLNQFWNGMGDIFKSVVTLIIAADVFSKGLIALGFIDGMVLLSENMGLGVVGFGIVFTILIFLAAMLTGSGNAAFFAFGPLIPGMAAKFGVSPASMILPMNFSANLGRTVSPVAGVIIASAEIAHVTALQLVKRNLIPMLAALIIMLIYHFV
jgi:DcuC family C4-dicarboxylate transporter